MFTYDGRGHVTQTIRHNGQVSSAVWNGDRQASGIDESGIETTYTYDPLGRIKDATKKGIAAGGGFPAQTDIVTTTTYDVEGHLTGETVSSGGLSLIAPDPKGNFSNKCSCMPKIITKVDTSIRRYRARFCKRLR